DAAFEYLQKTDVDAYHALLEMAEAVSESGTLTHEGVVYDVLLTLAPVLAWTRFSIPSGNLPAHLHQALQALLAGHIYSESARIVLAPALYAMDQIPCSHAGVFSLRTTLSKRFLGKSVPPHPEEKQEIPPFIADIRYLVALVMVPSGQAVFRWQSLQKPEGVELGKANCLSQWKEKATPLLAGMLPGCVLDPVLPGAFFGACRQSDQQIRPASIVSAVNYLTHALQVAPRQLGAVVAGFTDDTLRDAVSEYRVAFCQQDSHEVVYGIVWPVYGQDEMQQAMRTDIPDRSRLPEEMLMQNQLAHILFLLSSLEVPCLHVHRERFPMEFCEECGVPLFVDVSGELVHAEMPESAGKELFLQ
ncbi:MAG: DUF2863 family protein, partial [Burkholderiaceae bacterium]|nr:DUF2863 family protein [Burkholderiaceae bacterium]